MEINVSESNSEEMTLFDRVTAAALKDLARQRNAWLEKELEGVSEAGRARFVLEEEPLEFTTNPDGSMTVTQRARLSEIRDFTSTIDRTVLDSV